MLKVYWITCSSSLPQYNFLESVLVLLTHNSFQSMSRRHQSGDVHAVRPGSQYDTVVISIVSITGKTFFLVKCYLCHLKLDNLINLTLEMICL